MATSAKEEPPEVAARLGWRYHHMSVPSETRQDGEKNIPWYKMYVAGFSSSPYGIEWMRFEADCPVPHIIQRVSLIAIGVDDLDAALQVSKVLFPSGFVFAVGKDRHDPAQWCTG